MNEFLKKFSMFFIVGGLVLLFFLFFVNVSRVFAAQPPSVASVSPSSGPTAGGTNVTITGTNFDSGTVTIGGASATNVTVVSDTQITATTPAGTAGARDVAFTRSSDGKSDTLVGGFTYLASHTITASAGAHGSISPSGAVSVIDGDNQSFTIAPDTGYSVADVLVDDLSVGAVTSYDFDNVIADHAIAATFTVNPPTPDTTAPAAVSNLAASNPSNSAITLTWTAPGDDNNTGTAAVYDLRYSTSDITEDNWSSATQATGEPSPSAAGSSETKTVSGLSADTTYYFALKTSDEVPNESDLSNVPSSTTTAAPSPPSPSPSPSPSPPSGGGELTIKIYVRFSGQAYPGSKIEFLAKEEKTGIFVPESIEKFPALKDGTFEIIEEDLTTTKFFFALRAEDKDGRKTGILAFDVDLRRQNKLVVENIFFPPTVSFENTVVTKNQDIKIMGYAAPNNKVEAEINDTIKGETQSDGTGFWTLAISALELDFGEYYLRVRQTDESGRESDFSFPQAFKVSPLETSRADFNNDNKVNITDWSIFLHRWGSEDESIKSKIDMNDDGNINIKDFSIFLKMMKI
jgi:hypothetical protein